MWFGCNGGLTGLSSFSLFPVFPASLLIFNSAGSASQPDRQIRSRHGQPVEGTSGSEGMASCRLCMHMAFTDGGGDGVTRRQLFCDVIWSLFRALCLGCSQKIKMHTEMRGGQHCDTVKKEPGCGGPGLSAPALPKVV